jgi:hypothetical protein
MVIRVDKSRKERWVTNEEYWGVVENPIPVSLFRVEFDREPSRITGTISRALLSSNRGKSGDEVRLLPNMAEDFGRTLF